METIADVREAITDTNTIIVFRLYFLLQYSVTTGYRVVLLTGRRLSVPVYNSYSQTGMVFSFQLVLSSTPSKCLLVAAKTIMLGIVTVLKNKKQKPTKTPVTVVEQWSRKRIVVLSHYSNSSRNCSTISGTYRLPCVSTCPCSRGNLFSKGSNRKLKIMGKKKWGFAQLICM